MLAGTRKFLANPIRLSLVNLFLIVSAIFANIYWQVFCIPATWATIVLTICSIITILLPLLRRKSKLLPLLSFINGISFCVFIYCIIFLEHMNLGLILLAPIGVGFLIYVPHFLAFQMIWMSLIKSESKAGRIFFLFAIIICLGICLFIGQKYKSAMDEMNRFAQSDFKSLETNFMTEKILGMHFIYHTRFCEYDGWRPPIHEPILVIGMWLNGRIDPLGVPLEKRIQLYKKFFPRNKIKYDCACAVEYSWMYHEDSLLK